MRRAMERPIPLLAPVTMAILCSNDRVDRAAEVSPEFAAFIPFPSLVVLCFSLGWPVIYMNSGSSRLDGLNLQTHQLSSFYVGVLCRGTQVQPRSISRAEGGIA